VFKNDWIPFVCGTDVSVEITCTKVPIRTKGDGHWKKYTYQDSAWSLILSGLLAFDDDNWTGWDMIDNQLNFSHIPIRCSFTNEETGDIESIQGYAMIETSTLSWAPGQLVKDDFQLQGNGQMIKFEGLIPCDTVITDIVITGQTASDGIVHFSYTFTGPVYQVKYRVDGLGEYIYATAGPIIDVPGLPRGNHSVEIIPVCLNGFEGTGRTESFQVTQSQTCSSSIDSITVDTSAFTVSNTHSGPATQMRYRIDGGAWIDALITDVISIADIDPGDHTIEMVPVCSNNVEGTGLSEDFTIVSQPSMSKINWSFTTVVGYDSLSIYVDGTLVENDTTNSFGFFMAPVGSSIRAVVYGPGNHATFLHVRLRVENVTASGIAYDQTGTQSLGLPVTKEYTFTANGNEFQIDGIISTI